MTQIILIIISVLVYFSSGAEYQENLIDDEPLPDYYAILKVYFSFDFIPHTNLSTPHPFFSKVNNLLYCRHRLLCVLAAFSMSFFHARKQSTTVPSVQDCMKFQMKFHTKMVKHDSQTL